MKNRRSKSGVLDYIFAFLIFFAAFAWMLYLVVGYSNIGRIQNSLNLITTQGSRILSTSGNIDSVVNLANNAKIGMMKDVSANDLNGTCINDGGRIVTFNASMLYNPPVLEEKNITSTSAAYNEQNDSNCTYSLIMSQ